MGIDKLTPEQMERARACKTAEELRRFANEEGFELSDDELDGIVGGIDMPELPDERIDYRGFFIS